MTEISFDERMRLFGFRVTPQRRVIIQAIWDNGEHAAIEDILADVQAKAPSVSPATVYRTLELFIERDLVIATQLGNQTVYEIASDRPHHHLHCRNCGSDQKVELTKFRELIDDIDQDYEFLVETEHMVLTGLCGDCREQLGKT
jgi:Fur family ferric uptake transcriptional regulator